MAQQGSEHTAVAPEDEHTIYHVTPPSVYFGTFGALLVLTGLTVAAAQVDLGALNIWVALLIAGAKASLVAMFFMHLKYTNRFNTITFLAGIAFLVIFLAFTMVDTETRHWYPILTEISQPGMPLAR